MRAVSIAAQSGDSLEVNWVNPKLFVMARGTQGLGVFSSLHIKQGENLVVYGGIPLDLSSMTPVDIDLRKYFYQLSSDIWFGPGVHSDCIGVGECINHSCSPNAGFVDAITLAATKDIEPGTEVCLDYVQWQSSDLEGSSFECDCQCPNCRKWVRYDDWRAYNSSSLGYKFCQPHIQSLIDSKGSVVAKQYSRLSFPEIWQPTWNGGYAKSFMVSMAADVSPLSRQVHASRPISKGEVVFVRGGKVAAKPELSNIDCKIRSLYRPFKSGFFIGPRDESDVGSLHSLLPAINGNLQPFQGVFLVAAKDILKGDNLTLGVTRIDYLN